MTLGVICIVAGLGCWIWHFQLISKEQESESWPETLGRIHAAKFEKWTDDQGVHYQVRVLYSYFVHGVEYFSNRIYFGDEWDHPSKSLAERRLAIYKEGSQVKVHYNPHRPKMSVLEPGHQAMRIPLAGAIILNLLGIIMYIAVL